MAPVPLGVLYTTFGGGDGGHLIRYDGGQDGWNRAMSLIEKTIALSIAAACLVMLVRLMIGSRRRERLDRTVLGNWHRASTWVVKTWRWRVSKKKAAKEAQAVINRARTRGDWDGNVFRPKTFQKPDNKPRKPVDRDSH